MSETIHPMKAGRLLRSTHSGMQYCCFDDMPDFPDRTSIYQRYSNEFVGAVPKDWSDEDILAVIEEWEAVIW